MDLHVKPAFKKLLRPLSEAEYERLKANLTAAKRVRDPIVYWVQGEKNWILDGHNRFEIATELGLKFATEKVELDSEHAARLWILENQLGKRNLTPDEFTLFVGQLYNETKKEHGGDRASAQIEHLKTAEIIGKEHGIAQATVRRAGKTVELIEDLIEALKIQVTAKGKPPEDLLKRFAKADSPTQAAIAREMRNGESDWRKAASKHGIKTKPRKDSGKEATEKEKDSRPPRSGTDKPGDVDYGKCPNCASIKWTADEFGVSCAKCNHVHGEPTGGTDEKRIADQRSKTIKTAEALMRAFDDLNHIYPGPQHKEAISLCKALLKIAKGWT